ncbi:NAD(P)H-quinone oxidoreductase [Pleomorphomonas diazotrophica]|uniref:NAD(P)H-quinone oxidoreductase n=1 Tax=Pleomorphomonas diazotrophica TaxID=1166257 RepID=A0A1I4VUS5_9HYPH|nr:NAD(P)H-quinone oxidoreductase [Pleomorphomonas diazotrophica]PKR89271.1 NAD(P)H-quinone oxidoreductase [Pleomorphomonas diazotrophica]SFN04943.1 putative NAD(P)H quinone oxidoreductase, PIG3 family [Pleomorphomonas diazotrophica]
MAALPQEMLAIEISRPGGPEVLVPTRRPLPDVSADGVLISVEAAGVNRPDALQRQGAYPPPPGASDIPGLEVAGRIAATGTDVRGLSVGDRVTALVAGGGYAEYCAAPAGSCLPWPEGYDSVRAAALPETFFTVWSNVFERGRLQAGESFLVHGGTSGIGTTAIQLGRAFGARVFATAGSAEKCEACRRLGAEIAVNYRDADFVAVLKAATEGRGVDVILDMVGGDYIDRNYDLAAVDGRIVQIAFLGGAKATANFARLMQKRLVHTGSTLRPREAAFKASIAAALRDKVWPLLAAGSVAPVIDRVLPAERAAEAHTRLEADHIGKIVLTFG